MADGSIGDRVEGRWQAFVAAVTEVHARGTADVKDAVAGSEGVLLTAKEDGYDEEKNGAGGKKRKVCVADGCPNIAKQKGQLCTKHGGKRCSVDGCSTRVKARGLCGKHGKHGGREDDEFDDGDDDDDDYEFDDGDDDDDDYVEEESESASEDEYEARGTVDVKYAVAGSEGVLLTAKGHGLQLLGDQGKKSSGAASVTAPALSPINCSQCCARCFYVGGVLACAGDASAAGSQEKKATGVVPVAGSAATAHPSASADDARAKAAARKRKQQANELKAFTDKHGGESGWLMYKAARTKVQQKGRGEGKRKMKVCVVDGCPNVGDRKGQLCKTHGGKPCTIDGCPTKAMARGLCRKHGALGECLREGCTTSAEKKGRFCTKHTVKLSCADLGCDTLQIPGKFVCIEHGAFGYCTTDACISKAITMRGKCKKHDSKTVACSVEGCSTDAGARRLCSKHGGRGTCSFNKCTSAVRVRGRCSKHGGRTKKLCKEEGCTTLEHRRGVCGKHGAHVTCKLAGCTTNARPGSTHCVKHGSSGRKPCSVAGCTTNSYTKGLCAKHGGGRGECVFGGCTNTMVSTKWKTCTTHGGRGYCAYLSEEGDVLERKCLTPARKLGGNCLKHTGM